MKKTLYTILCMTFISCQTLTNHQKCAISNELYESSAAISTSFFIVEQAVYCRVAKTTQEQQMIDQIKPEALAIYKKNQIVTVASASGVTLAVLGWWYFSSILF